MLAKNLFAGQQWRNKPREKYYGHGERGGECEKQTSKQSIDIHTKFYFWTLNYFPLIYVSTFVPVTHCFHYHRFAANFQIKRCKSSSFVLLFQDCLFSTRVSCISLWILESPCHLYPKKDSYHFNRYWIESVD